MPVRVEQFRGHWMPLGARRAHAACARDGQPALGRGAVLGSSVWDVQHKFRIVIGPLRLGALRRAAARRRALDQLRALVRQYVGFEFAWDLRLILARDDVPRWSLGGGRDRRIGRLGRTAWLMAGLRRAADADDLVMNVESIRLRGRGAVAPRIEPADGDANEQRGGTRHE